MFYFVRSSIWLRKWYKQCTWEIPVKDKIIFLSFDDGPHPVITPMVLDLLKQYNAKASFFCIGKNVVAYPDVYKRIVEEGHSIGNHSYHHLNGWKTSDDIYLDDIALAKKYIDSNLFRPPYGRITRFQLEQLSKPRFQLKTIMWTILSGDFDTNISPEKCLKNVLNKTGPGSIVVFHDSEKAELRMQFALKGTLEHFTKQGYRFERISTEMA